MIGGGPIGRRIALATAAAVSLVSLIGFGLALTMAGQFATAQFEEALQADMLGLKSVYAQRFVPGVRQAIQQRSDSGALLLFLDRNGDILAGRLPEWPAVAKETPFAFDTALSGNILKLTGQSHVFDGGFKLLVARDRAELDAQLFHLRRLGLLLVPAVLIAGLLSGLLTSRILTKRIEPFNAVFGAVRQGDLTRRAPETAEDEFAPLARSVNSMLQQIDLLVLELGALSDRVAHELRTPLMRLQANLDRARDRADAEVAPLLEQAASEMRNIRQTFEAVLEVASNRAMSGDRRGLSTVSLTKTIEAAIELYEPAAEDKGVAISTDVEPVSVLGDEDLLMRLLANLLDNAIKFTPTGGRIHVAIKREAGEFRLTVSDTGLGMARDFADKATDLFARAPETQTIAGSGLGLALVAAIAARHGYKLTFRNANPGLIVGLTGPVFVD